LCFVAFVVCVPEISSGRRLAAKNAGTQGVPRKLLILHGLSVDAKELCTDAYSTQHLDSNGF